MSCHLNLPPSWPDIHPHSRNLVKDYLKSHPACVEAVWLIFDKRAFTCQQNKYRMEGPTVEEQSRPFKLPIGKAFRKDGKLDSSIIVSTTIEVRPKIHGSSSNPKTRLRLRKDPSVSLGAMYNEAVSKREWEDISKHHFILM